MAPEVMTPHARDEGVIIVPLRAPIYCLASACVCACTATGVRGVTGVALNGDKLQLNYLSME